MPNFWGDRVLLKDVQQLTFIRTEMTTSRRLDPVPQLVCCDNGSAGCPRERGYQFEKAICDNMGDGDNRMPLWKCTAPSLPSDVRLEEIHVSCEGYSGTNDPYVLRGSCSLAYTLNGHPTYTGAAHARSGWIFMPLVIIFGLCCALAHCSKYRRDRPKGGNYAPPPSYHADYVESTPVIATAVPADLSSKTTERSSVSQAVYDPEIGKGERKPFNSSSATASSSNGGGGVAKTAAVVGAAAAVAGVVGLAATRNHHVSSVDPTLRQGWEARVDSRSGRTYYVNHETMETTWRRPTTGKSTEYHALLPNSNPGGWGTRWGSGWGAGWGNSWRSNYGGHNGTHAANVAYGSTQNRGGDAGSATAAGHGGTQNTGSTRTNAGLGCTQNRTRGTQNTGGGWWSGGKFGMGGTQNRGSSDGRNSVASTTSRGGGGSWASFGGGGGFGGSSSR